MVVSSDGFEPMLDGVFVKLGVVVAWSILP